MSWGWGLRIGVATAVLLFIGWQPVYAQARGRITLAQAIFVPEERPAELEAIPKVEKKPEAEPKPAAPAPEVKPSPPPITVTVEVGRKKADFAGGIVPGFLVSKADLPSGSVLGGEGVNNLLGKGDTLFISLGEKDGVKVGDLFHAFAYGKEIMEPRTKRSLGVIVKILGELKVVSVASDSSRAIIVDSQDAITAGARVRSGVPRIKELFAKGGRPESKGFILAPLANLGNMSKYDVLFIDLGSKDGAEPGQLYNVFPEAGGPRVGRIIVLATQDASATALVVESDNPLRVGQQVRGSGE